MIRPAVIRLEDGDPALQECFDVAMGAARRALDAVASPALKQYCTTRDDIRQQYDAAQEAAWQRYQDRTDGVVTTEASWDMYQQDLKVAREHWDTSHGLAWAKYQVVLAAAQAKHEAARLRAWKKYAKGS